MRLPKVDFNRAPLLVIWETTRSCALACKHCRASAMLGRDPLELSTQEGCRLLDDVAGMGTPLFVLSGGDPLNRPDLEALVAHGKSAGLRMATIPAATPKLSCRRLGSLKKSGLDQIAFSLDAPFACLHDGFRRSPGAFDRTLAAAGFARELGLPLQINTCLAAWNLPYLEDMIQLVSSLGVAFWEVFFLIPVGRGSALEGFSPEQFEQTFDRLNRLAGEVGWVIKLTEAPQYRRFVLLREAERAQGEEARSRRSRRPLSPGPAVNAGRGFAFVDHQGNICPSGFLPLPAGNVRQAPLSVLYRESPVFRQLREPALLRGKCRACEFSTACSGSRARAWAATGDMFASDPACAYVPTPARA